jgi:hypothetical protein
MVSENDNNEFLTKVRYIGTFFDSLFHFLSSLPSIESHSVAAVTLDLTLMLVLFVGLYMLAGYLGDLSLTKYVANVCGTRLFACFV